MKLPAVLKNKDVIGWLTWGVITLALAGPCVYFMYQITYDTVSSLTRIIGGVFSAAILAGVLTWMGTELWFRIRRRQYEARRKTARKARRGRNAKGNK